MASQKVIKEKIEEYKKLNNLIKEAEHKLKTLKQELSAFVEKSGRREEEDGVEKFWLTVDTYRLILSKFTRTTFSKTKYFEELDHAFKNSTFNFLNSDQKKRLKTALESIASKGYESQVSTTFTIK